MCRLWSQPVPFAHARNDLNSGHRDALTLRAHRERAQWSFLAAMLWKIAKSKGAFLAGGPVDKSGGPVDHLDNFLRIYPVVVRTSQPHEHVCELPCNLRLIEDVSKLHTVPIQQWIRDGIVFKFLGDMWTSSSMCGTSDLTTK